MYRCRLLAALGAAMALTHSPSTGRTAGEETHARCEVAAAYARDVIADSSGSGLIFSSKPPSRTDFLRTGWWASDSRDPVPVTPPMGLPLRYWQEENSSAVEQCHSVRKLLAARGILYGVRAERAARRLARRERRGVSFFHMSLPVVSADGRHAILAISHSDGAFLELLERQSDGSWRAIASNPLAVF